MYIEFIVTTDDFTFQKREEDGTAIGSLETYPRNANRLDWTIDPTHFVIFSSVNSNDNVYPPVASYPRERTILTTV